MARDDADITVRGDRADVQLDQADFPEGKVAPAYRHLERIHRRQDVPFLLADVFLDEKLRPLVPEEFYSTKTAMRLVSELPGVRIADARQILSVGSADLETATLLEIPLNDPVVHVQRLAMDEEGTLILVANGFYRGDKVRIDMKLVV